MPITLPRGYRNEIGSPSVAFYVYDMAAVKSPLPQAVLVQIVPDYPEF
jgi:hypothetical protein